MQITNLKREIIPEVFIPKNLIQIVGNTIRIFALDATTIGLSNTPPDFWPRESLWEGTTAVVDAEDHYSILFPDAIVNFYSPRTIDISGDPDRSRLLLVVNSSRTKRSQPVSSKKSKTKHSP